MSVWFNAAVRRRVLLRAERITEKKNERRMACPVARSGTAPGYMHPNVKGWKQQRGQLAFLSHFIQIPLRRCKQTKRPAIFFFFPPR